MLHLLPDALFLGPLPALFLPLQVDLGLVDYVAARTTTKIIIV
jgi:hypothetical protein